MQRELNFSKKFGLVVRLKTVEMKYGLKIKVTHVSGKRMQAQGTDERIGS